MKPGSLWRVLAHRKDGTSLDLRSGSMRAKDQAFRDSMGDEGKGIIDRVQERYGRPEYVTGQAIFDEVVVDGWLHVEQMTTRWYWMLVGETHINVKVGKDGRAEKMTIEGGGVPFTECDLGDQL